MTVSQEGFRPYGVITAAAPAPTTTTTITNTITTTHYWDTRWRSWLRHYATSQNVAGSILSEVIWFFNWPNPSSRTMALGSTQALTETSAMNLLWGKGRPARKADNLTAICEPIIWKMWEPRRLTTLWASTVCYRDTFTFFTTHYYYYYIIIRYL
jgi:hypothetical protein